MTGPAVSDPDVARETTGGCGLLPSRSPATETVRSQTARFALDNAATRWACVLRARRAAGESRQRHLFHTSTMFRSSGETNARGAPPPGSRCPPMVCSNWTFRPPPPSRLRDRADDPGSRIDEERRPCHQRRHHRAADR